jgi:tight adherence protein B
VGILSGIGVLIGTGVGIGMLLMIAGLRGQRVMLGSDWTRRITRLATRFGIAVATAVVIAVVTGWPIAALLAGVFAAVAPRLLGGTKAQRRDIERTEALAAWTEMLRDTMAGAAGIEGAITASAALAPEVIRPEVKALSLRLERESLVDALQAFADDVRHPTADLVVAALSLAANKSAKRLGELLGSLATAARADATMRLRVDAGRARTRTSVRVVVGATLLMAAGLLVLNRSYLEPYGTPVGQLMLGVVGACFGAAFYWMDQMTRQSFVTRSEPSKPTAEMAS